MPRLVNAPLHPAVVSVNRIRALRAATTSYCEMLYERAYKILEHRKNIRALTPKFEHDAALIRRRVILPEVEGKRIIHITVRNAVNGEVHVATFPADEKYGKFFQDVRRMFHQPTHKTSVSMRLWHETDPKKLIEERSECRLGTDMHNKTLCCIFYQPQPADERESDSSEMTEVNSECEVD